MHLCHIIIITVLILFFLVSLVKFEIQMFFTAGKTLGKKLQTIPELMHFFSPQLDLC